MRRVISAGLAFLLAACAVPAPSYRDTSVPIASIAAFDATRFAGRWHEIARFPAPFMAGCAASVTDYTWRGDGQLGIEGSCPEGAAPGALRRISGAARVSGPGRLDVRLVGVAEPMAYWVLWVDEDYRTAVIGMPSGQTGWILNRDPAIPSDRLRAAWEILDWNGYDLTRLQMLVAEPPR